MLLFPREQSDNPAVILRSLLVSRQSASNTANTGPPRPLSPSPGPGTLSRWQLVLLYLTDPHGKFPRHFEPSGCLPLLAPRNIQLLSGTHCSLSRTRSTRITLTLQSIYNCATPFPIENSQRHRSLLARARRLPRCRRSIPLPCSRPIGIASATPPKDWHEGLNLMP